MEQYDDWNPEVQIALSMYPPKSLPSEGKYKWGTFWDFSAHYTP